MGISSPDRILKISNSEPKVSGLYISPRYATKVCQDLVPQRGGTYGVSLRYAAIELGSEATRSGAFGTQFPFGGSRDEIPQLGSFARGAAPDRKAKPSNCPISTIGSASVL